MAIKESLCFEYRLLNEFDFAGYWLDLYNGGKYKFVTRDGLSILIRPDILKHHFYEEVATAIQRILDKNEIKEYNLDDYLDILKDDIRSLAYKNKENW